MATIPVVIAYGVEFRDYNHRTDLENWLDKFVGKQVSTRRWKLKKGTDTFDISVVLSKAEFIAALDMPGAIVIYDGHARRGQGPAFSVHARVGNCPSVGAEPANPWEDHVRIGFDAVLQPVQRELLKHCTNPVEYPQTSVPKGAFLAESVASLITAAAALGSGCKVAGARRSFDKCEPTIAATPNGRGVKSLAGRHFYIKRTEKDEDDETKTILEHHCIVSAGSADLAKSTLACSVLFLNSCSSAVHYLRALRRRKKEAKASTVFYLTWRTAYMTNSRATNIFVQQLLEVGVDPTKKASRDKLVKLMNGTTKQSRHDSGVIEAFV
jgi:hypothetical protein